jgi:hypothetical protein
MWLILLEALGAGCILVLIVWWTMFSGRSEAEAAHEAAQREANTSKNDCNSNSNSDRDTPQP